MKKIILTITISLSALLASGQQQLSYSYDAAGNRINRTIIVGTQRLSEDVDQEISRIYVDSLGGKELAIRADHGDSPLSITVKGYDSTSKGEYSLLDERGKLLAKKKFTSETTLLGLDVLPTGSYALHILLNRHSSIWKLVKL